MNWAAVGVMLGGVNITAGVLYFALRSFVRAELAEQRAAIMRDINGTYLRKDVAEAILEQVRG